VTFIILFLIIVLILLLFYFFILGLNWFFLLTYSFLSLTFWRLTREDFEFLII